MAEKYEYIGPDGELVNRAIEADRATSASRMVENDALAKRAKSPVKGQFTARENVKALGALEARLHDGFIVD